MFGLRRVSLVRAAYNVKGLWRTDLVSKDWEGKGENEAVGRMLSQRVVEEQVRNASDSGNEMKITDVKRESPKKKEFVFGCWETALTDAVLFLVYFQDRQACMH